MAKKFVYIGLFTVLGIIFQFLVHAGIEIWYVGKLLANFEVYGFGWSWNEWVRIHDVVSMAMFFGGAILGYLEGAHWYARSYNRSRVVHLAEIPTVTHYFELAAEEARRSPCRRSRCGAVIVKNGRVIGKGCNAPPLDRVDNAMCEMPADGVGKPGYDMTCCMHAEWRAILDAMRRYAGDMKGARLYFTRVDADGKLKRSGKPYCTVCSRLALDTGIGEFTLWHQSGITVYKTDEYNRLSFAYREGEVHEDEHKQTVFESMWGRGEPELPKVGVVQSEDAASIPVAGVVSAPARIVAEPPAGLPI